MNTFDFQIQTTASDGKCAPAGISKMAKDLGIETIAITDHDTVGGTEVALEQGRELGVRVIPGIELSVEEHNAHILGYGIDVKNPVLLTELEKFRIGRIEGAQKMVQKFIDAGFVVFWEDVEEEAVGGVIARPHIARAILKRRAENADKLAGVENVHDFFEKFFKDDGPFFVKRTHIWAKDAIALIHHAGGIAVWSHPAIHFQDNYEGLEAFLGELMAWGIDGMEVFNPSHTEDDAEFLHGLAVRHNLLVTGGSDFHEPGPHTINEQGLHSANTLGDFETYGFSVEHIPENLISAIEKRHNPAAPD